MSGRKIAVAAVVNLALVGAFGAAARAGREADGPKTVVPGFERIQALTGDWIAADDGPMTKKGDLVARYHPTGAGSAVVEELFPGTEHQMTTVYSTEGGDLVLTHYCTAGNQPRMRAKGGTGRRFDFAFDGGANLDAKKDRHMHTATLEFLGADEIRTTWNEFDEGKPAMSVVIHLVRKAS